LRNTHEEAAPRAVLRRKDADAGAVAKLINLVEQIDDVEPHGERLGVRRPFEIVCHADIDHGVGRGVQGIRRDAIR
jgi:hypothetical protein